MNQHQSDQIDLLAAAIVAAQLELEPAKKDATNPFFHSKYADLPAVWDALAPFRKHGIAITQPPLDSPDGYICIGTQLTHVSGQFMRSMLKMRVGKDDPQGYGSALTYARRYALGSMTGLVTEEDDDGNAASPPATTKDFATKFPEQAQKIAAKLATPNTPPATLAPASSWVVPFGKNKGQSISDVTEDDLDYLLRYYQGKLNDPANTTSRYRGEWEEALDAVRGEMLNRIPVPN